MQDGELSAGACAFALARHCFNHRSFSGVGFFTELERVEDLRVFDKDVTGMRGDARAVIGSPPVDVGFVFGCEDGYVTLIECFTFGEPFPETR